MQRSEEADLAEILLNGIWRIQRNRLLHSHSSTGTRSMLPAGSPVTGLSVTARPSLKVRNTRTIEAADE